MNHCRLTLTSKCNQNCLFCLIKGSPKINLSFKDAILKLNKARKKGAILLSLDGGEPTILPYLRELIEYSISCSRVWKEYYKIHRFHFKPIK